MRLNAISARFAAFSISSRHSRITSGLRRVSTPPAPIEKTIALTTRNQAMFTGASPAALLALGLLLARAAGWVGRSLQDPDGLGHRAGAQRPRAVQRRAALVVHDAAAAAGQ